MTLICPYIGNLWEFHNPDWLIFFRGVETTNQKYIFLMQRAYQIYKSGSYLGAFFRTNQEVCQGTRTNCECSAQDVYCVHSSKVNFINPPSFTEAGARISWCKILANTSQLGGVRCSSCSHILCGATIITCSTSGIGVCYSFLCVFVSMCFFFFFIKAH